jgi:hypothetical protein
MPVLKIKKSEISDILDIDKPNFPPYTTFLINQANGTAQSTRANMVGQMSELVPKFLEESDDKSFESWKKWYLERYPDAIDNATEKTYNMILNFKEAINQIDKNMVKEWVEDLVIAKSYYGQFVEGVIIKKLADDHGKEYRLSTPEEESKGIDGVIGDKSVSIKPSTYKTKSHLDENIEADEIIYYDEVSDGLKVEYKDLF